MTDRLTPAAGEASSMPEVRLEELAVLGELTSSVAHEFNNILNNIMLHLAVLEQKGLSPELRAETALVKQASRQAATLVRQLQDYRHEKHKPLVAVALNQLLRAAVGEAARLELAADLPPVLAHESELQRLVMLLMAQARASGGKEIVVQTARAERGVELSVRDDGPAIAAEVLPRLFVPFVVARPGDDGVRLAVCKSLVRRLQGMIHGENRPEGGVVIVVELRSAE